MMTESEIDLIEEYIVELIKELNPEKTMSFNKCLILFTCLDNKDLETTLPFISKGVKPRNKIYSALPTICYEATEAACSIINAQEYFFSSSPNEHHHFSLINLMYILTFYNNVKIIITIQETDIFTHTNIIAIINSLVNNINSKYSSFVESIGFAVGKTSGKFTIENYTDELKKINKNDVQPETWDILNSIISQKSLIQVTEISSETDIIEAINNSAIKIFQTSPKVLTDFYKNGLKPKCFESLRSELFSGPNSYEKRIQTLMSSLKKEIEVCDIFSHIEEERTERLKKLTENIPFQNVIAKASFLSKKGRKLVQFPIQVVILIFTELEKIENDFYEKDKKEPYTSLNIKNGDKVLFGENDILNQSLMGVFLSLFFNENTVFYNKNMIGLSKYLHIFLRIFENFPGSNIRESEESLITEFGSIITKTLINYFTEKLNESVENLTEKKNHWKIEAKKLLSLTKDVGSLQKQLKEMKFKKRELYIKNKIAPEEIFLFSSIFLFLSEKCYEVYKEVWRVNKKNKFMADILLLCQDKDFKLYLSKYSKQNTLRVLRMAHRYFGEWCLRNKLYFLALKFFEAAKLFSRVIETCRLWLNKMLKMAETENEFDRNDIELSIEKIVSLGLIEEAREWCYKFCDEIEDNSFLLGILEDLTGYGRNYNKKLFEHYEKLQFEEVFVIEEEIVKNLRILKEFDSKDWLEYIEEFSN